MKRESCSPINCQLFGRRAAFFESHVVPLWQGVYDSIVSRAGVEGGVRALDVGTGSGEVALRLAGAVGEKGRVVAIDAQDEMLRIARRKARRRGRTNIEFEKMQMESMDLPDDSFDSVVACYSLCCCMDYRAALEECQRVLRSGGRLTYSHGGPYDSLPAQVIFKIFEGYKTNSPSKRLIEIRDSSLAQVEGFKKYRDPYVALELLRSLGYDRVEAALARHFLEYGDPRSYVDEWLLFDWHAESEEIPRLELESLRKEATEALRPLSRGPGFRVERDVVYYTAKKR